MNLSLFPSGRTQYEVYESELGFTEEGASSSDNNNNNKQSNGIFGNVKQVTLPPLSAKERKLRADCNDEFKKIHGINNNKNKNSNTKKRVVCREQLAGYVDTRAELWSMLHVNLSNSKLDEQECRRIATRVVMELASGKIGPAAQESEIDKNQFFRFRKKYILDPKGSQEFFQRTVFAAFDRDGNGTLDAEEIDELLDIFYQADSIFKGDKRLPPKDELTRIVYEKLDENGDGVFSFEEIRSLISGSALRSDLLGI